MSAARFAGTQAILFDLDGTLADTAPDLAGAANQMRAARALEPLPFAALRPVASHGARGLLKVALGAAPSDPNYEALRTEFLDHYAQRLCSQSELFPEVTPLLEKLAERNFPWGIVTNKASRFATPLVEALALVPRALTVVCGDTTPHAKPHPAPLLYAAARLQIDPGRCIYVGDDRRDIEAGRAAGMATVAAAYGYCADTDPRDWGADALIHGPLQLMALLDPLTR